jgi:hypothetical protein
MARSPLIVGANLTLLDDETVRLLTNADILNIDQHATASRQVLRDGDLIVWTADIGKQHAVAAFNIGEKALTVDRPLTDFDLAAGSYAVKNAWTGERMKPSARFSAQIEPHAPVVLIVEKQ